MRRTRIIATIGPATIGENAIDALVAAGVDIFRLNFSHGTRESHGLACERIRRSARERGRQVAVLQDLSGPKIRTGRLDGGRPIVLPAGSELLITTGTEPGRPGRVSTSCAELAAAVRSGDRLLVDDGRIELRVIESDGTTIRTTVVDGGELGEHKGINAPGVPLPPSAITPKDVEDLAFGLAMGVDLVALSFVQDASDVLRAREVLAAEGRPDVPLVAKLERPAALARLDEILQAADAVMVARGDLGLEMPLEAVPRAQKEIIHRARLLGRPVIVATQVLESMRTEPRPTRAEVSDAAGAVDAGADAVMLSGETAVGLHPVRAVEMLAAIIRATESAEPHAHSLAPRLLGPSPARALAEAAVTLAEVSQAEAIVAVTRGGATARLLSALRPRARVFAATCSSEVARRLVLHRGVVPVVVDPDSDSSQAGVCAAVQLKAQELLPPGAAVVFVSVSSDLGRADANFIRLQRV
ncbi:MAG: pyruvate kinase [Vicinamibacterales bacterium]